VIEQNKPLLYVRGTYFEVAMKFSPRKDLRDLYKQSEYVDYTGMYVCMMYVYV
jgi:hypothetical protein